MKIYIPQNLLIILAGVFLFLLSCSPMSCFEETESYVKASFYSDSTKKMLAPDSLTLHGLNNDSIIYNKTSGVQPALIPLNSVTDNSAFVMTINKKTDTVKLWYNSYPHLVSKECGFTFYHNLDSVTSSHNLIDTILIRNSSITTANEENIRIFY